MGDNNDEDSEKFTILYFLHLFVLSNVKTVVIPRLHFDLVDSGRFKNFSWDSLSFEDLARSLNNRLKASGKFYLIKEMSLAIQVWLYECCSNVPPKIASKVDNRIPRLLNWKTIAPRPHFEFLMNAMFKDNGKVRQEIKGIRHLVKKKFKKMLKESEQSKQQHEDTDLEAQQMDYAGVEILPQQFSSTVDQNLGENQETTKGYTDLHPDKTNIEIDSQHLIPDELLQSINLDYNLFEKIVHHDIRQIDVCFYYLRKKSKYDPNRCIFLYDSYEPSGHYPTVLAEIKKLAEIIPLCLQQSNFYVKKGIDVENHSRYKDKDSSDMFDVLREFASTTKDCGLYMITYVECLSYGYKVHANEFDFNALHKRYAAFLWDYGTRKQDANAHSDVKAPLRPARESRITSVTEVFDV
ncbi:hypothetical protein BC332_13125 [Capsicum chinense]|nr:hypothetical protein BC332_13125 [Capsicum chinense]